jgi:hypothetical protein
MILEGSEELLDVEIEIKNEEKQEKREGSLSLSVVEKR